MAGLKDIKTRISSVSSNMQITSAMKMVSASKFKKAVDRMHNLKIYQEKFKDIQQSAVGEFLSENKYSKIDNSNNRILIIALASNRGLCGPFNINISKRLSFLLSNDYQENECHVISLSKKIYDLQKKNIQRIENRHEILDNISYENIVKFSDEIIEKFLKKEFSKVIFIYNSFKNASMQIVKNEIILPLEKNDKENTLQKESEYIFEPTKKEILNDIIPQSIRLNIFRIILETIASEHGARMTAMHKATENATDLKKALLLEYNKIRQAAITNQIIEIISGAEAV